MRRRAERHVALLEPARALHATLVLARALGLSGRQTLRIYRRVGGHVRTLTFYARRRELRRGR